MAAGAFIAVVGPSGSGKDSLLNIARARFASDPTIQFVRRLITRPADDANEDHEPVSPAEFDTMLQNGRLALSWDAHGLRYGIPAQTLEAVGSGTLVIANLSRAVIGKARTLYPRCVTVGIAVDANVLRQRLETRGRENPEEIEARLRRTDFAVPQSIDRTIENNDTLECVGERFCALIASLRGAEALTS